jgi:chitodextrinase
MKRIYLFLMTGISFCMLTKVSAQTNVASLATPSTSYVSSWETLAAVNDGFTPANSNDKAHGAYGNWNNPNTIEWVQYDWSTSYDISKVEVYWFDDNGGVLTPTTAYVEYWNGSAWVNFGTIPKVKNAFNVLNVTGITSNKVRLSMLNTTQSTGILEFRVWGTVPSTSTNVALTATATTSYVSSWETLTAVNDGFTPANSNDKTHGAYGNWNNPNTIEWVQYDWTSQRNITKIEVYWFDDNGGVLTPTTAYVEYWNGSAWVNFGTIPKVKNAFNALNVSGITSNKIRLSMLNTTQSTGVIEWRAWGSTVAGGDTQAPSTPGKPTASNITETGCTLAWSGSTDNVGVTGYQILRNGTAIQTTSGTSVNVTGLTASTTYSFTIKAYDAAGNYSAASTATSVTTQTTSTGNPYSWPTYSPNISYNFADEFPSLGTPSQILNDCPQVVSTQSSGWWTFRKGPNANSLVTSAAVTPLLARMNTDFAYFRDQMGWPPDLRAKNGYKSSIYLYGSGLCTDNASNTDLGGWQSAIYYNGQNWPMVLASYYPIYSYDPACTYPDKVGQQGAMVHEGIHSLLADLPGVKQSAWFHEGGNVWLQQTADARRSGDFSEMGFLNGTDFIAPFMPIECYTGWLQDGSFGGPSAEGVNMTVNGQQICTWRTYLGGHQYSSSFPTFLGNTLGDGAVPWIWRNCPNRVLEGIAGGIGATQTRRLISEYRAKQAIVDFGPWNSAIIALLDAKFQSVIQAEWQPSWLNPAPWTATPYVATTNNGSGLLTPESRTTPGWSGGNQIPLNVTGNMVTVNFQPIGANMTCQLVYRATDGTPVYSQIVASGNVSLRLDKAPANGVVIAVIANTDYIYNGESTRTAHFDYRLQLGTGVTGTANIYTKWYLANSLSSSRIAGGPTEGKVGIDMSKYCSHSFLHTGEVAEIKNKIESKLLMYPNPYGPGMDLHLHFDNFDELPTTLKVYNALGQVVYETVSSEFSFNIPAEKMPTARGLYIINLKNAVMDKKQKLMIE